MKSKHLFYFILIGLGLIIAIVGFLLFYFFEMAVAENIMYLGIWQSEVVGFFMLFNSGSFKNSKYFRLLKGVIALIILGALFKIMHWPYGNQIYIAGIIGVMFTYFLSFLKKQTKRRLDFLKLAWVIASFTIGILIFLHQIGVDFHLVSSMLMWLCILDFLKTEREKGKLFL